MNIIPDRIVIAQSVMTLDEVLPIGIPYTVRVSPNDRRGRASATVETQCTYDMEYFEIFRAGACTFDEATRELSFVVQPNVTGTYWITVYVDGFLMANHPMKFSVATSLAHYDPATSTATGSGLRVAEAGQNGTIFLFLRDFWGNTIRPEYHMPLLGYPFWSECGYNYDTLQDGTPTAGYGNPGTWRWALPHGCKIGLHLYSVDWRGFPTRPARGFQVLEIRPQPDGSVKFVYRVHEAGLHSLYLRYLNSDRAGYILHNESGHLSLASMNRSREGQIHGSPFQLTVVPGSTSFERTRVIGPGVFGGSVDNTQWTRFDVVAYDAFGNPGTCNAAEVEVIVKDSNNQVVESLVEDSDGNPYDQDCHVFYRPKVVGKHRIDVNVRGHIPHGAPFFPTMTFGTDTVVDWMTRGRLITSNTRYPCFWNLSQPVNERCHATSKGGSPFAVRVSARDPKGFLPSDQTDVFSVKIHEESTGSVSDLKTYRLFQGEHEVEAMLTASGVYHISVSMTSNTIIFDSLGTTSVTLVVAPGPTHPASCLISGEGLSIATAGIVSSFSITPRDAYGNRQVPTPSPDPRLNAPGAGIFHVRLQGPTNTLRFASVSENPDGTFSASYSVQWMGQYSVGITMLDEVPALAISGAAVVKKSHFRSGLDGHVETAPGRRVSNVLQPIILQTEPNVPSSGSPCDELCCEIASRAKYVDLGKGPAVAGESFKVALELVDICGNPTLSIGEDAKMTFYGPLSSESTAAFVKAPLDPGLTPLTSRANNMHELHEWQETFLLTISGDYGIAVSLNGALVDQGVSIIRVLPVDFTATEQCILNKNISTEPVVAAGFDFLIYVRDPFGNDRTASSEIFELDLYPIEGYYDGVLKMTTGVDYISGGTYHARITGLGTYGSHILTIRHEGRHVHGSPFQINVIGGYLDADNTDVAFTRVTSAGEMDIAERVLALRVDDTLKLKLQGRDENGALTRLGLGTISFSVVHELLGDITPTADELNASRTQTLCTETNYGTTCDVPPPPAEMPLFFYEPTVDANSIANYEFRYQERAKCRSLSGYDVVETVFHNTKLVEYPVVRQELGGQFGNETVNRTYIIREYHPTTPFDVSQCEQKCAEFNCTCATLIQGSGTYRDGVCIALGNSYFLERFGELESPGNASMVIITSKYRHKPWETVHYERPLVFNVRSRVSGNIKLHVNIRGQKIRQSPVLLFYSPGLLSINESSIIVQNENFDDICLHHAQTNCVAPAAGQDFTMYFTPRDAENNYLVGSPPESQYRIRIQQGGEKFEGLFQPDGKYSLSYVFAPKVSGIFQISVQQETPFGDVMKPFATSTLKLPLKSSPNSMSGREISFDRSSCTAACNLAAVVPNDVYDNSFDASYNLLLLDLEMHAYLEQGVLSNLIPASKDTGSSTYEFYLTRSGRYLIDAKSIHGPSIPGSPLALELAPARAWSNVTQVIGPGIAEVTIYEKTFFDIETRDQYGNSVPCNRDEVAVEIVKGSFTVRTNTTSGNSFRPSCRSVYMVTLAGMYSLQVLMGGNVVAASNITTELPPGTIPSMTMSPTNCYVISSRTSRRIGRKCLTTRTKTAIGDELTVKVQERTAGGGLVGELATLIAIEGENATAPHVVNHPNYTRPQYPWTVEIEECDQLLYLLTDYKVCSPIGNILIYPLSANSDTLGDYSFNETLQRTGIFKVIYKLPGNFGFLRTPWYIDVQAMETDLSKVQIFGSGLDMAYYSEESTFTLQDRDMYGNLRAGTELVSIDFVRDFRFEFEVVAESAQTNVDVKIRPEAKCLMSQCILSGTYNIAYKAALPSTCSFRSYLTCPDALKAASATVEVSYKKTTVFSRVVDIALERINYVPSTAKVQGFVGFPEGQVPSLLAGLPYTLNVQPQDQFGNRMLPSFERLNVAVEQGQPDIAMGKSDGDSIFSINMKTTVAGSYSITVFDGEAHVKGSPFTINVLPGPPNPQSCDLQGASAFVTSVDAPNQILANLVDTFGNLVTESNEALVTAFISTVPGAPLLQIPGIRTGRLERIQYVITRPGNYRMQVKVGDVVVDSGRVTAGSVVVPLTRDGHMMTVLGRGTCAAQCQAFGQGLTISTAGLKTTFFILAKDEFGTFLEQRGEFFGVTVDGRLDSRCSVSTADGYQGGCMFTTSGSYSIALTFGGEIIADKRVHILKVEPDTTYPLASYLEQKSPKVFVEMVDGQVYQSTTNLEDGAFLGSVGRNSYTLVLQDRYGNRLNSMNFAAAFNGKNSSRTGHDVRFWVKRLLVDYAGGFLMREENAAASVTNSSQKKEEEDGLDEFGNPIKAVIVNATEEEDEPLITEVPDQPEFNKTVVQLADGTYSLSFHTNLAGKYRLQVYIDGFLIRRHIPLVEISWAQMGQIKSNLDCCVPWDDLRKIPKEDGVCPGAGSSGPVCGDLITLLPLEIDPKQSVILGNVTKEFRKLAGGDGEGNKESPVFRVATFDRYRNTISAANFEMLVTIYDSNGTVVVQDEMTSLQPTPVEFNCRTVPANPKCGMFEYQWTGLSASRSGKYLIDVTYNGISVGNDKITSQIRSVDPQIRECQIWGPGLQISVVNQTTYFYFRVKDKLGNDFEPDAVDDKLVAVDFGGTAEFFGISYPGLDPVPKLQVDSVNFNPRTRMIYFGYGLFQVQYTPWLNASNERGNIQMKYGDGILATPGTGVFFAPLILGPAGYDAFKPAGVTLVPDSYQSFATGSGLYNHFAGDEIEVTAHAMTSYKDIGGGYWPSTTDDPNKHFVVEIRGPPGVKTRRFRPRRGSTPVPWQFQTKWISTVSGMYSISILYDNVHLQGDSSTNVILLPSSPYSVQVFQAPVQPKFSTLSGTGLSAARIGEISTFLVSTRDAFNNSITSSTYNAYKGDEFVNASLTASKGPAVHARTVSLRDGSYRCEYTITKSGQYSLMIMINGVPVTNPPLRVIATNFPDFRFTTWFMQRAGLNGEMCKYSDSLTTRDVYGQYLHPGCISGLLYAGDILEVLVRLRDARNNSIDNPLTLEDVNLKVKIEGSSFVERQAVPLTYSTFSSVAGVTRAGSYSISVSMGGALLPGSPFAFEVSASLLYIPACFTTGDGLQSAVLNRTRGLIIHGRDIYGNNQTLLQAELEFGVHNLADATIEGVTSVQLGMLAYLQYRIEVPGDYQVSVRLLDPDYRLQVVPGSDVVVTAFLLPSPQILVAQFTTYGDTILIQFDRPTDMACMHGRVHDSCLAESSLVYEDCCFLFQTTSCQRLGMSNPERSAKCIWQSPYEMEIILGFGVVILPRDRLTLKGVIRNPIGTSNFVEGSVHIDPPTEVMYPILSTAYFPSASTCQDVWIDASLTVGSGGRSFEFAWSVGPELQPLHNELKAKPKTLDRIEFGHNRLSAGITEISLTVKNFLNYATSSIIQIKRDTANTPLRIMIMEGTNISMYSRQPLTLTGKVEASSCSTVSELYLRWSQVRPIAGPALNFENLTLTNTILSLPAYFLSPGASYELSFEARGIISGREVKVSTPFRVEVLSSPLVANIAGPYGQVSRDSLLVWDATASFDPDLGGSLQSEGKLEYDWSCNPVLTLQPDFPWKAATVSNASCFYDFDGILLQKRPLLNLTGILPSSFMCLGCLSGTFRINVNVSRNVLNTVRWAMASSVISISETQQGDLVAGIIPVPDIKVSPSKRLYVDGFDVVDPLSPTPTSGLQYEWTLFNQVGCCLGGLNMSKDLIRIFPTGTNRPFLIIKPETLSQGLEYVFQFTIKDMAKGTSSSTYVHLTVDSGPRAGKFLVAPADGTMIDTTFQLECLDWTDDVEDLPLEFDFEYTAPGMDFPIPLLSTKLPKVDLKFPDISKDPVTSTIYVKIRDIHGTLHREERTVLLRPSSIISLTQAKTFVEDMLGVELQRDVNSTDMKRTIERINIAVSVLNKLSAAATNSTELSRRSLDSNSTIARRIQAQFNPLRTKILAALNQIAIKTTHTKFTVRAISTAMFMDTKYPEQIEEVAFNTIISTCEILMMQSDLFVDNINASIPFAGILRNALQASRLFSTTNATRLNLKNDEVLVGKVMSIKNILSQAILKDKLPDEEFVPLQTSAFFINCRRVRATTAKGLIMGANSLLESQHGLTLEGSSSYSIYDDTIDFQKLRYKVDDGSFVFGTYAYPGTVYDVEAAFPKSVFPAAYKSLDVKLFQHSPPITQLGPLTYFYLDFDITQWQFSPFTTGERQRTDLDWASINYGRSSSIRCSSQFIDCSDTNHICTPPPIEGSQGPDYADTHCDNAFDGDETTSWAVDPKAISDPTGAGSSVSVKFVKPFIMTMIRYTPRVGPRYCAGNPNSLCETSSRNCTCIIGGDRELSFTFSDGTVQNFELAAESYDAQIFDMIPVMTDSVDMTILSVYSNPSKCPPRDTCAWWQPACVDWCPNGAASIEFLSTEPLVMTYDYNYSYMKNYSVAAALVSDVTSIEVRQYDHVMRLFALDTPLQLNMTVQKERRSSFSNNDQTIVVCRSWDDRVGRWSSRGTLLAGLVEDPVTGGMDGVHSCEIFFVSNFSLVLVEKPYESIPTVYANSSTWALNQNVPDSLVCASGLAFIFMCYCILVFLRFRGWLKIWHKEEAGKRTRMNEYLISLSNPLLRGKQTDDRPVIQPFYYPIVGLLNSRVISAHAVARQLLYRIHLYSNLARWHYLYAMVTGHDEISRFARITSFFCLVMFSFALNACTISGATFNGASSLIQTKDMVPQRWWYEAIKAVLVIFPIAQVLPAFFRLISMRHEDFDRWEISDVQYAKEKVKPKVVFGMDGIEKRSDLKTLRFKVGSTAVFDLLNPVVQEDKNAPPKQAEQMIKLAETDSDDDVGAGSLKHYVRKLRESDPSLSPSGLGESDPTHSLSLSMSVGTGTGTTGTGSTGSMKQDDTKLSSEDTREIRKSASLLSRISARQAGEKESPAKKGGLRRPAKLGKQADDITISRDDEAPTMILDEDGNDKPRPPTPREEDPPPVPPMGVPARNLTYHQERSLLRKRWMKRRDQEAAYFASPLRRAIFELICGDGYSMWFRGQRPMELLFFPSYFIYPAYALCFFWLLICYCTCLIYTTGFDRDMAFAWAYASMTTLAFECLISQSVLALACGWWIHIDGRVTFYRALTKWCLFRSDLMPAMG